LSIAALVFVSTVFAQTEEPPLPSDSTVPVKLAGGAERLWRISLPEGQTANLEIVEQQSSPSDGSAAQAKKEVDGLVEKFETVEAEIRRTSPRYAALLETHTLSLADVQSELKDSQTALAEFWLEEERSYGWLITMTACQGFELPARRENRSARTPRLFGFDRPQSHSRRMPLGKMTGLSGAHRLWVVSDGALESLPFAALPAPGSSEPPIVSHRIARLRSASVLS
jgi:hypothetical protein